MAEPRLVFLFDVDNTLLDHDRATEDLKQFLARDGRNARKQRYWEIFEQLRAQLGYADYLGALQLYRLEYPHAAHLIEVSLFLLHYPFAERVYPNAFDAVRHASQWGATVILTDGDVVFQPHKIESAGLLGLFQNRVLIYVHKEQELRDVEVRYPADHYVMVDDKLRLLAVMKQTWGERLTTVFVNQGHYAHDPQILAAYPRADIHLDSIGEFLNYDRQAFLNPRSTNPTSPL